MSDKQQSNPLSGMGADAQAASGMGADAPSDTKPKAFDAKGSVGKQFTSKKAWHSGT